jgi:hypothetical protein
MAMYDSKDERGDGHEGRAEGSAREPEVVHQAIPEPVAGTSSSANDGGAGGGAGAATGTGERRIDAAEQIAKDVFEVGEKFAEELGAAAASVVDVSPRAAEKLGTLGAKIAEGSTKGRAGISAALRVGRAAVNTVERVKERGGAPLERLVDKLWKTDPLPGFPKV